MYHFGERSLDPVVGRWNRPDPTEEFPDAYSYVGGNPVAFLDPAGEFRVYAVGTIMNVSRIAHDEANTGSRTIVWRYYVVMHDHARLTKRKASEWTILRPFKALEKAFKALTIGTKKGGKALTPEVKVYKSGDPSREWTCDDRVRANLGEEYSKHLSDYMDKSAFSESEIKTFLNEARDVVDPLGLGNMKGNEEIIEQAQDRAVLPPKELR
jgi:hypothetical protein